MENKEVRGARYRHIRKSDRLEIALLRGKGHGVRNIAAVLGFSHSSVSRELRRNAVYATYDPTKAQQKAYAKRRYSKYQGMKIAGNVGMKAYVKEKLILGWTPEQIAGRLKRVDIHLPYVSSRAIYKFLYSAQSGGFWMYLKSARHTRRKRGAPKAKREIIKHRIFIDKRPAYVEQRGTFGHFEVDRIESNKTSRAGLLVAHERKSRYYAAVKTKTRKPDENKNAILLSLRNIARVKSLTYDNDIAFAHHEDVNAALASKSFFCHPYHSWEKGGVENANKLMREYIPKGSNIARYSKKYIRWALERLNHRPRECLLFKTPYEVMYENHQFKVEIKNTTVGGALRGSV